MELPAARVSDEHVCPQLAHKGGPVITGSPDIHIEGRPAARATDPTTCLVGGPDRIAEGCGTVHLNGEIFLAARLSDRTEHNGALTTGAAHVYIGQVGDAVAALPIGVSSGSAVMDPGHQSPEHQPRNAAGSAPKSGLLSEVTSTLGTAARTLADFAGKLWAAPMTALGLVWGGLGHVVGQVYHWVDSTAPDPEISLGHNAIEFTNNPFVRADQSFTLGNAIIYSPQRPPERNNSYGRPGVNVGRHEEAHTYQYQVLGPLYPFVYFPLGGSDAKKNPLEAAAQNYGAESEEANESSGSWWPW